MLPHVSFVVGIMVACMIIEQRTSIQIYCNNSPTVCGVSCVTAIVYSSASVWWLGVRRHLGQRRDRQVLLGCWCVSLSGQSLGGGLGAQAPRQPHSPNPFWLKPTLRVSSVTFATFRSHRWPFWKRLRWDPFRKEEGRRDGKPNGTRENHSLRLK